MPTKSLYVRCGCDSPLCKKAVRFTTIPGKKQVSIAVMDDRRVLAKANLNAHGAWRVANWLLVFPEQARRVTQRMLAALQN